MTASRPLRSINRALQPSPPPVARAPRPTTAAFTPPAALIMPPSAAATTTTTMSAPSAVSALPAPAPASTAPTAPTPAPANATAAAHDPRCGCTGPKLGAVIDHNELLPGDILQYSNGARVRYVRKQGANEYIFNRVNGGRLGGTHQGPKSIAVALAGGRRGEKGLWSEFEVFRGLLRLGTLFEVRHAAYAANRL
jgi:hypothetical protein